MGTPCVYYVHMSRNCLTNNQKTQHSNEERRLIASMMWDRDMTWKQIKAALEERGIKPPSRPNAYLIRDEHVDLKYAPFVHRAPGAALNAETPSPEFVPHTPSPIKGEGTEVAK